ncbi:fibrinogen C domain-containing protein 1-A [Cherax quadricarinatus]|uniref:fibrinogen C domain-containing protein 1-A n=1 Tax=Cherax quadricarinatus TaxID=27406 RepID=UPI00387E4F46
MAQLMLLLLLLLLSGCSAALPEPVSGNSEESNLIANMIFSQIALQEEHKGLDEGITSVKNVLIKMLNLTEVVSTRLLALDDTCTQGIEKSNVTRHLLDKLDLVDGARDALEVDNQQLKEDRDLLGEENSQLKNNNTLLAEENTHIRKDNNNLRNNNTALVEENTHIREDNRNLKNNNTLLEEEITHMKEENDCMRTNNTLLTEDNARIREESNNLKTAIHLSEEENRKTKNNVRLAEEEISQLKEEIRQMKEDVRLTKERNRELEHTETELKKEKLICNEMNNNTHESKKLIEEQLGHSEDQVRTLRERNTALQEEKDRNEQLITSIKEEIKQINNRNVLTEGNYEECKKNITHLSTRLTTAKNCADLYCRGARLNGVYLIKPVRDAGKVSVWCDMTTDGGGWTVFLNRDKAEKPWQNFTKDWSDYKAGFGNVSAEYWLGLETLHQLTLNSLQALRLSVTNLEDEHRWAHYSTFNVADESTQYQMRVEGYQEASTMGDPMVSHHNLNGSKFSTRDRDNDNRNGACTEYLSVGGGWWYKNCAYIAPTGSHEKYKLTNYWTKNVETWINVQRLRMMMRPQNFPTCDD